MLTPPRLCYDNLVDESTTVVTASTAATGFAATQVQSYYLALPWRATGKTSEWLKFDFGSVVTWYAVIIWFANLTVDAVVTLEGSDDDSAWTPIQVASPVNAGEFALIDVESTFRYLRITMADTTNTDSYIEVSRVFVGDFVEADFHQNYDWTTSHVTRSVNKETPNGVRQTDIRPQYKRIAVYWERVTPQMREAFGELVEDADTHIPIWLILDRDTVNRSKIFYVNLDESLSTFVNPDCDQYSFPLTFVTI